MATEFDTETENDEIQSDIANESGTEIDIENKNEKQSESERFHIGDYPNNSLEDQRSTRSNTFPPNVEINEQTKDLKKKRGRPKKNASITKNNDDCGKQHTKYSPDNIKDKLFRYFSNNFLLPHVNKFMKIGFKMRKANLKFSVEHFKLTVRDYFSFEVSKKYRRCDPKQNFYNLKHVTNPSILDMKLLYIFEEGFKKGNNNIFTTQGSNDDICKTYCNCKEEKFNDENYLDRPEQIVNRLLKQKKQKEIFEIVKIPRLNLFG